MHYTCLVQIIKSINSSLSLYTPCTVYGTLSYQFVTIGLLGRRRLEGKKWSPCFKCQRKRTCSDMNHEARKSASLRPCDFRWHICICTYIPSYFYIINIYYCVITFHFIENVQQVKNIISQKEKPNKILHHRKKSLALLYKKNLHIRNADVFF